MIINNKELATRLKLGYSLFILVYLILLVLSLIFTFAPNYIFEIIWTVLCVGALIVYMVLNYCYIYYNDEGEKIIYRYQPLHPFIATPKSIEIPKKDFYKYEIYKSFFGKKHMVIFYRKTKNGIAKYNPVSIISLKKKEKESLFNSLSAIIK
ncbi:MAG: hypothetical protein HY958_06840 [Bacteroidia bacterium]|nr:hypothetical protein [Bacteroidia bacterium]